MSEDALLERARKVREQEHRLRPELRLETLDQVRDFIHAKGFVTMLGGTELPGLVSAILGREWRPSGKGFTAWLDWWDVRISGKDAGHLMMDIPRMKDIIGMRIFRNSKTIVSDRLWPVLDPIIRHYGELVKKRKALSQLEWRILDSLSEEGQMRTDMLRAFLKLEGKMHTSRFHRALSQLESSGLIVGYEDPNPERHLHASIWQPWTERVSSTMKRKPLPYDEALGRLLERTIDAAVLAREKEVDKWFSWEKVATDSVDKLVSRSRVVRVGSFLVPARIVA